VSASVVIATYRRPQLVGEAIESALSQSAVREVIVVDDCRDGSAQDAVHRFRDARVKYVRHDPTSGGRPGRVRNYGTDLTKSRYVQFLDDDDRLAPGASAALVSALESSRHGIAFGRVVPFGDDPKVLAHESSFFERASELARSLNGNRLRFARRMLFGDCLLVNGAGMFRRDVLLRAGGYDPDMTLCEDVDLYARVGRRYGFSFVDVPVLQYRTGAPSLSSEFAGVQHERVNAAYRKIVSNYVKSHGHLEVLGLKVATKARKMLFEKLLSP
jgi:glycosyltransferase involved in cell wall biosynthesis